MIHKSNGKTPTESYLAEICDKTFLKLWSYANPYKVDKKEFCDLLAIFENHMFIFFDREKLIGEDILSNTKVVWNRWYRDVVIDQIKTCYGAERYIRSRKEVFIDKDLKEKYPIPYDYKEIQIHKILIAHGAEEACSKISSYNINGSLGIVYKNIDREEYKQDSNTPFLVSIDRNKPVHIFDSYNLPILLSELDTFFDFKNYIVEKEKALKKYWYLSYCGEEDLLAHYFLNFDESKNCHYIGTLDEKFNAIHIEEGEWNGFIKTPAYKAKKEADKKSYMWDRIIIKTCNNALLGTLGGNSNPFSGKSAIFEMAKEPRFSRRALSEAMINAINKFPDNGNPIIRYLSYMPSFYPNKGYVFLQLKAPKNNSQGLTYREIRQYMLEIACAAAKNKFEHIQTIIGIAVEPPKINDNISEDFILMDCSNWDQETIDNYRKENEKEIMRFFLKDSLIMTEKNTKEFPDERLKS